MGGQSEVSTSPVLSKRFPVSNKYSSTLFAVLWLCYLETERIYHYTMLMVFEEGNVLENKYFKWDISVHLGHRNNPPMNEQTHSAARIAVHIVGSERVLFMCFFGVEISRLGSLEERKGAEMGSHRRTYWRHFSSKLWIHVLFISLISPWSGTTPLLLPPPKSTRTAESQSGRMSRKEKKKRL